MNFLRRICCWCSDEEATAAGDNGSGTAPLVCTEQPMARDDRDGPPENSSGTCPSPSTPQQPNCQCAARLDKIESHINTLRSRMDYNDRQLDAFLSSGIQPSYSPNYVYEEQEMIVNNDSDNTEEQGNGYSNQKDILPVEGKVGSVNENLDRDDCYRLNRNKCRCLIFSHKDVKDYKSRVGAEREADTIQNSFKKLGFRVTIYQDKTFKEIKKILKKLKRQDFKNGCVAICVCTHGTEGDFLMAKDVSYPSNIFVETLSNISTLVQQPKLVFIQACRGKKADKGISRKNNQESNEEITDINSEAEGKIKNKSKVNIKDEVDYIESPQKIPSEADYYIVHSTFPGYTSYRGWFFDKFCDVLDQSIETDEIDSILRKTNNAISLYESVCDDPKIDKGKQISTVLNTLRKNIYLKNIK